MDPDEALSALRETDRERRQQAARSLWETSRSEPHELGDGLETLQLATEDEDPLVRGHAVATLGETLFGVYDDDAPIPELDGVLARLTDEDDGVRQTVTGLFWNRSWWLSTRDRDDHPITDEQRHLAAVGLVECLEDPIYLTRMRAAKELHPSLVLDHPDPEQAAAAVVAALDDEGAATRSYAAELLVGLADVESTLLDPHVEQIRQAMSEDEAVRSDAGAALAKLVDRFHELAAPIAEQMTGIEPKYSSGKIQRLSTLGTVLATVPDFEGSEEALAVLESSLTDPSINVRPAAAAALAQVAASEAAEIDAAVPELRERLHDYHEGTRRQATGALAAALDADDVEPPLKDLFEAVDSEEEPPDPLLALADSHPEYVTDLVHELREETPNPYSDTRLSIATAFERNPAAVHPVLEDCVTDLTGDDEERRNGAAWLLARVTMEVPAEGRQYEAAIRAAVDRPNDFEDSAHRKLQKALEELDGNDTDDSDDEQGCDDEPDDSQESDADTSDETENRVELDEDQRSLGDFS